MANAKACSCGIKNASATETCDYCSANFCAQCIVAHKSACRRKMMAEIAREASNNPDGGYGDLVVLDSLERNKRKS